MERSVFVLVIASVLLSAFAQIALKAGMSAPAVAAAAGGGLSFEFVRAVGTSFGVIGGLMLYFLSAAVWLLVLAKVDVGFAYPFVGLGFVVTLLLAYLIRGEVPTPGRVAGALIICLGVVVLSRS